MKTHRATSKKQTGCHKFQNFVLKQRSPNPHCLSQNKTQSSPKNDKFSQSLKDIPIIFKIVSGTESKIIRYFRSRFWMTENKLKTYSVQADIIVIRYEIKNAIYKRSQMVIVDLKKYN